MSTDTNRQNPSGSREMAAPVPARPRVLFICGSVNQTSQMHKISREMPEIEAHFTPYYCDGGLEVLRRLGILGWTILGAPWRRDCFEYLNRHNLPIDLNGAMGPYDLVVTCSDLVVPKNVRRQPLILVQEGMTDPEGFWFKVRKVLRFLPLWSGGTSGTGLSGLYDKFCVASPGYRDLFAQKGADGSRIVVTGIPNFDDCRAYLTNDFDQRGYVLVCTSDARETLKFDNRKRFIRNALRIAEGRPLIFKLHPNENIARSTREIKLYAPGAQVFTRGSAEEMVANCDVLIVQYSTLAYVGLALGKEVHAYLDLNQLRKLLPLQGGAAARNIAEVCTTTLQESRQSREGREGRPSAQVPAQGPREPSAVGHRGRRVAA